MFTKLSYTFLLDGVLARARIIIGDLIITELMQGFRYKKELAAISEIVNMLEYRDLVGREIAEKSAANYRYLRKKGAAVRKTIDVIIGTFCIENDMYLRHDDRDFTPMEKHLGLKVIQGIASINTLGIQGLQRKEKNIYTGVVVILWNKEGIAGIGGILIRIVNPIIIASTCLAEYIAEMGFYKTEK